MLTASNSGLKPSSLDTILDLPAIQSMMEDMSSLTEMAMALLDLEGNILVATGWADICTRFHRVHPECCKNCLESDLYLSGHTRPGQYVLYRCRNLMWDAVTPLYIADCHMGNIYAGQFFLEDEEVDEQAFIVQARRYGFDETSYMDSLRRVPRISHKRLNTFMDYLVKFTTLMSASGLRDRQLKQTVNEQLLVEQQLIDRERQNRALLSAIPDLIFVLDAHGTFLDYRAAADAPLAVSPELIIGNNLSNTMPPDIYETAMRCIRQTLDTGEIQTMEYGLTMAGRKEFYEARMVAFGDDSVLCISQDISERKSSERRLLSSEARLNSIIRNSPIPQFVIDNEHRVLYWNDALENYSGVQAQDVIGTNCHWKAFYDHERPILADLLVDCRHDLIPEYYADKASSSLQVQGAYDAVDFFPQMAGGGKWLHFTAAAFRDENGKIIGAVETLEDISERKEREEELRRVNEIQSLILENSAVGIAFVRDRKIEWANPRIAEMLKRPFEEIKGSSTRIIYSSDEENDDVGVHGYAALGRGDWFDHEGSMMRGDGSTFHGRILGKALDPKNPHDGSIWIFEDIDLRKLAEEERDALRHLMKNIIDSMPSILVAVDIDGRVTQWNLEAVRITGIGSDSAVNHPLTDLLPAFTKEMKNLEHALKDRQLHHEHRITTVQEGETRFSEVMIYPLEANAIIGAVVRIDDITEKVRLEEMMIQTEKMMSVGGLAAGMAHEINNPLGGILQGTQNLLRRLSDNLPQNSKIAAKHGLDMEAMSSYMEERQVYQILEGIQNAGFRASNIVNNMLQFSRRSSSEKELIQLAELIDRSLDLAANDYDLKKKYDFRHINVVREYAPGMRAVPCVLTEIEQVILNLLKNSAHALLGWHKTGEPPTITVRTREESGYAVFEIEDNGPGMNDEIKKRIFEPFFTTKESGVGTGLGLSVSYFIISENHGGQMQVFSNPRRGARFVVQLPINPDL